MQRRIEAGSVVAVLGQGTPWIFVTEKDSEIDEGQISGFWLELERQPNKNHNTPVTYVRHKHIAEDQWKFVILMDITPQVTFNKSVWKVPRETYNKMVTLQDMQDGRLHQQHSRMVANGGAEDTLLSITEAELARFDTRLTRLLGYRSKVL